MKSSHTGWTLYHSQYSLWTLSFVLKCFCICFVSLLIWRFQHFHILAEFFTNPIFWLNFLPKLMHRGDPNTECPYFQLSKMCLVLELSWIWLRSAFNPKSFNTQMVMANKRAWLFFVHRKVPILNAWYSDFHCGVFDKII